MSYRKEATRARQTDIRTLNRYPIFNVAVTIANTVCRAKVGPSLFQAIRSALSSFRTWYKMSTVHAFRAAKVLVTELGTSIGSCNIS